MNVTTNATCINLYKRFHLTDGHQNFLVTYSITIIGVSNLILNALVVALLFLSKQIQIPSMRLFLYSSLSDILLSIIAPVSHTFLFKVYGRESNCTLEIVISTLIGFFSRISAYMICLIGYDRYARVKYLNQYKTKITPKYINRLVGIALTICVLHRILVSLGLYLDFHQVATFITIIMDIGFIVFIIVSYVLAAKTIKGYRRDAANKDLMKSIDKTITKMAKYYLSSIVVFYILYIIFISIYFSLYVGTTNTYAKGWLEFIFLCSLMMGLTNSAVNASIFIILNKKARQHLNCGWLTVSPQQQSSETNETLQS